MEIPENDVIEEEENLLVFKGPQDIIDKVLKDLVPMALGTYEGLLLNAKSESVLKATADKIMEIANVTKTDDPKGSGVSFHFTGEQIQTAFGDLKGLKDVKIKQIEEDRENGKTD